MGYDRFMIAPVNTGLQTDIRPWLLPDDAFAQLDNAYVFRGRVRKRFGSSLMALNPLNSRFRINIGVIAGGGLSGNVRTIVGHPTMPAQIGQAFSVSTTLFTAYINTPGPQQMLRNDGSLAPATYDISNSDFNITATGFPDGTIVYFYPALPVMGLPLYEIGSINDHPLYGFDTCFSYVFTTSWNRVGTGINARWSGTNSDFFWTENYRATAASDTVMFTTNFVPADGMRYWDGSNWNLFAPVFNGAGDFIKTARLILSFKDRLILFNTVENITGSDQSFVNRARYSQNGSALASDAWREQTSIPGRGGFVDATTKEQIISAQILKDRVIVFFEASTWEFVYTGNDIDPFRWQRINVELGVESSFSIVPFDKVLLGVGNVGVHACNGANVERIDEKIPSSVFDIHNGSGGVQRVYGIRDYFVEMVYWTFPSDTQSDLTPYPNRVLVYNYRTGSWAFNVDTITCFGYFQQQNAKTWADVTDPWESLSFQWNSGLLQEQNLSIVAGNQHGFTFIIMADESRNASNLQITDIEIDTTGLYSLIFTVIDHNLTVGEFIKPEMVVGLGSVINQSIYQVYQVLDNNRFRVLVAGVSGTYQGGGILARVSNINILTKQFNPYSKDGKNVYIHKIDFYVDKTSDGQVAVDYFPSSTELSMVSQGNLTGTLLGSSVLETSPYELYPLEQEQNQLWHPVYFQVDGDSIQFRIYMNDAQMIDPAVSLSDFQLHAMVLYTFSISRLQ